MQHAVKRGILVALIGGGVLLAGCSRATGSPGSPLAGVSALATASTSGESGQPTPSQVTLTLDNSHYARGETISVTIHNGLSTTIWATDHQTSCTVVTAEHLQDGQWQPVGDCRLKTPTILMPLPAASTTTQQLVIPQSSSSGSSWPNGTYRVTLGYTGGDEGSGAPGGIVHSPEFTIG
jgi:hypothetical protein